VNPNVAAFLSMIAQAEGTDRRPDPYRVCYGYIHTVQDMNYHPAEHRPPNCLQEWKGEDISHLGAQYKDEVSTAAGRYQITRATWLACKQALALEDFRAASQNQAAILRIRIRGALDDVHLGRLTSAVLKCDNEWASFPGGKSGQPERVLAGLTAFYTGAGGVLA
jgi:muramidase (phage lysozyme)